jgi:CelD/BcsL family acetyltransferase involved in cellulose biosynthesis
MATARVARREAGAGAQVACSEAPPNEELVISLAGVGDLATLEREWTGLETRASISFFQSWAWIGCWLRHLPGDCAPLLLRAALGRRVVALGIFLRGQATRHGFVRSNALHLHETGRPELDCLTIEHNGLVVDTTVEPFVTTSCIDWLVSHAEWDELHLPGIAAAAAETISRQTLLRHVRDRKPVYAVNLDGLRETKGDVAACLSANARYQLRRACRAYEVSGVLRIQAATTVDEGLAILSELKALHQQRWQALGHPGAFASRFFEAFHADLVRERLGTGAEVQLLRITAGEVTVGCLYNFLLGGHVYCYQSGLAYRQRSVFKPGLVCHTMAMRWNLDHGARVYDLLAGENQLKRTLGTDRSDMVWLVLQRRKLRFQVEGCLRKIAVYGQRAAGWLDSNGGGPPAL